MELPALAADVRHPASQLHVHSVAHTTVPCPLQFACAGGQNAILALLEPPAAPGERARSTRGPAPCIASASLQCDCTPVRQRTWAGWGLDEGVSDATGAATGDDVGDGAATAQKRTVGSKSGRVVP